MNMKSINKLFPRWAMITIIVAAIVTIAVALIALSISSLFSQEADSRVFSGPSYPYIARIKIVGEISGSASRFASSDNVYHHKWTIQTINTLMNDSNNKGICLWIDTPGGAVYECDELYLKLMEYKERTGRPIYAYMRRIATSGGYYTASAADEVFANRNTWTGSIGVTLGTLFDVSGFLEKYGIKTDTITSGQNKAMGNYYEPMTDEQRAIFQSLVDDAYDRFVAIVAEARGMTDKEARVLADGRLFTAGQALDAGLIDGIMGETDAETEIKSRFEGGASIYDCFYKPDTYYLSLFTSVFGGRQGLLDMIGSAFDGSLYKGDVAAVLELVQEQAESGVPPLKYLYVG